MAKRPRGGGGISAAWIAGASLAAVILALAGAEWWCRVHPTNPRYPFGQRERYLDFLEYSAGPCFERRSGPGGVELAQRVGPWKTVSPRQRFPLRKAPGTFRILVLGESSADRLGYELAVLLQDDPRFEVLNCGLGASSFETADRWLDEALDYDLNGVVLALGHNVYTVHPRWAGTVYRALPWLKRSLLLDRLAAHLGSETAADSSFPDRRLLEFSDFLVRVARRTSRRHLPLVAVVMPSNLRAAPSMGVDDAVQRGFLEARFLAETGRQRKAIERAKDLASRRAVAWWEFWLGDLLARQGDLPGAYRRFSSARDLDFARIRASAPVNDAIRWAARRRGAFILLDEQSALEDAAPGGVTSWESFEDAVHVHETITRQWARQSLERLIAANGWPAPRLRDEPPPRPRPWQPLLDALTQMPLGDPAGRESLVQMLEHWQNGWRGPIDPLLDQLAARAPVLDGDGRRTFKWLLAEALWRAGRRQEAWALNREILSSSPSWPEARTQKALFFLREGRRREARDAFRDALRLWNDPLTFYFEKWLSDGSPEPGRTRRRALY